jgi:hypothetical protein
MSRKYDLCDGHVQQLRAGKELKRLRIRGDDDARFARYTRVLPNGCVEWVGAKCSLGYGRFSVKAKPILAHRWRWQRDNGPLDAALHLDHYRYPEKGCIGPSCVLHVRPVTPRENTLRGNGVSSWCAAQTKCTRGHRFDEKNTYVDRDGKRKCRKCAADHQRGLRAKRAAAREPRTHCAGGHDWNDANIGRVSTTGHHYCRACNRERNAARRAAHKAAQQT